MSEKNLILIYTLAVILVIATFFIGRRSKKPTSLNMEAKSPQGGLKSSIKLSNKGISTYSSEKVAGSFTQGNFAQGSEEKSLNIYFNYNGETFEAYEVLGVPAGSSLQFIKEHLKTEAHRVDRAALLLYREALLAIEKANRNSN